MFVYLLEAGIDAERLDGVEATLKPALPGLARIRSVDQIAALAQVAGGAWIYALIVAPSTEPEFFSKLATTIGRFRGNVFFVLISGEISATNYKRLVQAGNADWASDADLPKEVADIITRVDAMRTPTATPDNRPVVVSFQPSAGGVGNTTLAMETAVQLARKTGGKAGKGRKGEKVGLIDLDFQTSHACDYLDIQPHLNIEEIIDAPHRLDSQLLDVFVSRHSSGLEVLAAARNRGVAREPTVESLSSLFDLLAQRFSHMVIDLPVARHPWTAPVLAASLGIFVTGRNTIPGLRQISETLVAVRADVDASVMVRPLINNCEVSLFGRVKRRNHVERILADANPLYVRTSAAALECVNIGSPMSIVNSSDKLVRDISAIAKLCAELKPLLVPKPS